MVAPSIIIILIIARILNKFKENKYVEAVFLGLRPASIAMIAAAGMSVVKIALINIDAFQQTGQLLDLFVIKGIILAIIIYVVEKKTHWHPILLIAISAVVGIVFQFGV